MYQIKSNQTLFILAAANQKANPEVTVQQEVTGHLLNNMT